MQHQQTEVHTRVTSEYLEEDGRGVAVGLAERQQIVAPATRPVKHAATGSQLRDARFPGARSRVEDLGNDAVTAGYEDPTILKAGGRMGGTADRHLGRGRPDTGGGIIQLC